LGQVRRVPTAVPYLAFAPRKAEVFFRALAGERFVLVPQEGQDLGERLGNLSSGLLAAGHAGVVIIDSDTPSLPDHYLATAVERIGDRGTDAVFGPAEDGGYYLVGLRHPMPALFQGIAWSTSVVLKQTLANAASAGLTVHLLPPRFDVDTGADLKRLADELATNGTLAGHTRAFLQQLTASRAGGNVS
jgi:rSAM/selenodomain-associated transferase 1